MPRRRGSENHCSLYTEAEALKKGKNLVEVPDVLRKSIREANNILTTAGLKLKIAGSGLRSGRSRKPEPWLNREPGYS